MYQTGDSARKDKDGYIWIIGRIDDVIKVSGYRLGTAEVESALVSHPAVAEAAAIGLPHELKGNAIHAYVILRAGVEKSDKLAEELRNHVAHEIGPIAKPEHDHLRGQPAQDAQRQDHAPAAEGPGAGAARGRYQHAGRIKLRNRSRSKLSPRITLLAEPVSEQDREKGD